MPSRPSSKVMMPCSWLSWRICVAGQARVVGRQVVAPHHAGHLDGLCVEPQVAAQHTDAVVTVAREIVEGGEDTAEQAGRDQPELDLLQRPAVKLLGDLDLDAAPRGRG